MFNQRYMRHANDAGDRDITPNAVFNLCFVPAATVGAILYRDHITTVSQKLAAESGLSDYVLDASPATNSAVRSHVHVTASHVVMRNPDEHTCAKFAAVIMPLIGTKQSLTTTGLQFFSGAPFERLSKATDGEHKRLPDGMTDRVIWSCVTLTEALRNKQNTLHQIVPAADPERLSCVSGKGDQSIPHHTMYVERVAIGQEGKKLSFDWANVKPVANVDHVLAVADCGPWGQVRQFTVDPRRVYDFVTKIALS